MQSQTNSLCARAMVLVELLLQAYRQFRGGSLWSNIVLLEYSEIQYRDGLKRAGDKIGVGLEAHLMN